MKKKNKIIIIGGKGTAVNIAEGIIDSQLRYGTNLEFLGFAFDDISFGDSINGYPILCKTTEIMEKFGKLDDVKFIFQMHHQNKMKDRAKLIDSYKIPPEKWYTFIHPSAYVAKSVKIGHGSVVFANCAIHSNASLGNHCTLCALTTVGHDTTVGDNNFMATHVCIGSSVKLGDYLFFGQNTSIKGAIKIADNNLIGIGSNVVNDINISNKIFIGSPAKELKDLK